MKNEVEEIEEKRRIYRRTIGYLFELCVLAQQEKAVFSHDNSECATDSTSTGYHGDNLAYTVTSGD